MNSVRKYCFSLILLIGALPVYADPLPTYVLDKDYQSCVGQDTDPNRAAYCNCVRDGMKSWDLETYGDTAMQAMADSSAGKQPSGKLADLAKSCMDKTLH